MRTTIDRRLLIGSGLAALGACATGASIAQQVSVRDIDVWPGAPPGSESVTGREEIIERSTDPAVRDRAVLHVRRPILRVFKPGKPDGSAVLICPGGGYQRVVLDKEGDETAMRLAKAGVTAAVLIYRLPGDGWAAGYEAPLQDAQRAMRLLRSGAAAKGIDPRRVGVLGFSAGGHLAANLALRSDAKTYDAVDAADQQPARPDFAALIYAAYLDGVLPAGLGVVTGLTPDLTAVARKGAQPVFLLHAADDATVPVENSIRMYQALKAAGVPAELHVFPEGGHGFGISRAAGKPVEVWPDLFLRWGSARGMFRSRPD
jgi:acetyl esterase/lipase